MQKNEIRKELNSISTFNVLGLFGIIIPFLAWIFAGIAFSKASNLINDIDEKTKENIRLRARIHHKKVTSVFIIFISFVVTVIYALNL